MDRPPYDLCGIPVLADFLGWVSRMIEDTHPVLNSRGIEHEKKVDCIMKLDT